MPALLACKGNGLVNVRAAILLALSVTTPLCVWGQNVQNYSLTDLGSLSSVSSLRALPSVPAVVQRPLSKLSPAAGPMVGQVVSILGAVGLGLNSAGSVTGNLLVGGRFEIAFLFRRGMMETLGTLGGTGSGGTDINAAGEITGFSSISGDAAQHPFLYSHGVMSDLGTLGGSLAAGTGINSRGQITGWSTLSGSLSDVRSTHAFLYSGGAMHDLGTLTGPDPLGSNYSQGAAINSVGQVTGDSSFSGPNTVPDHAFLYSDGVMNDLGTLGGTVSVGQGINDFGQVTGFSSLNGRGFGLYHAFLYSDGVMHDLGTLAGADPQGDISSAGAGINSKGQITGWSYLTPGFLGTFHAFLYSDGRMTDLNTLLDPSSPLPPGVVLTQGWAINNKGTIVASGNDFHAYVLTPVKQAAQP